MAQMLSTKVPGCNRVMAATAKMPVDTMRNAPRRVTPRGLFDTLSFIPQISSAAHERNTGPLERNERGPEKRCELTGSC
jgi:hypothetical protein